VEEKIKLYSVGFWSMMLISGEQYFDGVLFRMILLSEMFFSRMFKGYPIINGCS
jgi:hypothetical protein